MHNTLKLYASVVRKLGLGGDDEEVLALLARMNETALQRLPLFVQSGASGTVFGVYSCCVCCLCRGAPSC